MRTYKHISDAGRYLLIGVKFIWLGHVLLSNLAARWGPVWIVTNDCVCLLCCLGYCACAEICHQDLHIHEGACRCIVWWAGYISTEVETYILIYLLKYQHIRINKYAQVWRAAQTAEESIGLWKSHGSGNPKGIAPRPIMKLMCDSFARACGNYCFCVGGHCPRLRKLLFLFRRSLLLGGSCHQVPALSPEFNVAYPVCVD